MVGTVTHDIAQYLNVVIRRYSDRNYTVKYNKELLLQLDNLKLIEGNILESFEVEFLFFNVLIDETIKIRSHAVFNHPSLLRICATETGFSYDGLNNLKADDVRMFFSLGPTFADFYMSTL